MTKRWVGLALVGGMLLFTAVVYGSLPEQIPTHWNVRGEVDGWSSRFQGALLAPLISAALWLLLPVLRRIDPRRSHYERFEETFWLVINLLILLFAGLHVLTLGAALGWGIDVSRGVLLLIGLLFAALGNFLPRVKSNWWIGIRTPWTLESEAVWRATHRLAGITFVVGGLAAMLAGLLPHAAAFPLAMMALIGAAFVPVVYSYVVFRRESGPGPTGRPEGQRR